MEARLRRLGPGSKIEILELPEECSTKIWLAGRGTSCHIYTKSKFASRQHFRITYKEHKYFISDLQSVNGTFLNDVKLVCETPLAIGNLIGVGVPSDMQNSLDCIVYIFESCSDVPERKQIQTEQTGSAVELKPPSSPILEYGDVMDVDPPPETAEVVTEAREGETFVNDGDVVLIDSAVEADGEDWSEGARPAKIRKVEEPASGGERDDDDCVAYEAPTQVDEVEVKSERLLDYSMTEELIEISDSEEDWSGGLKGEGDRSPEEGEEEEVVFVERIVRSKEAKKLDAPPVTCKVEEDLTEVDRKWLGRLLKVKREGGVIGRSEEGGEERVGGGVEAEVEVEEVSREKAEASVDPCAVRLSRLSTEDVVVLEEDGEQEGVPGEEVARVESQKRTVKRAMGNKSVTFDLVPQVRYFSVPWRPKLTASEKGRLRFMRVIFNICNWNTHWLEECKRVAPDKDPPDICEERLRKIPNKFPFHSDYMGSFIPVMLLQLWNKVKEKWVKCGESGFRQTVSCDSIGEYHTENLYVYKCTGLVQNVDAHKELLREGHLVLLRLHQSQNPQFPTSASEKYSKKLGYLVFGFIEGRIYERFQKQSLHEALAERCASIVGDLHVVRLTILVKKRPSFQVDKRKLIQLTVVQSITQEMRMFRGICFLPDSPLCSAILRPTKVEFSLVEPPKKERLVFKGPLDEIQSEIVRKLSFACLSSPSFMYSIHGAAGTGKGQVIAGLILQLLRGDEWAVATKDKRPKIIYCTQWSIPLDEMVTKLKASSKSLCEPVSLVRVGPIREVKPEVRDVCLSSLAANLRTSDKKNGRYLDAEVELLRDADVICTTCLTAGIAKMSSAFDKILSSDRNRKVVCIIDDAMSSSEKDSIIPLLLGVTHLILVGDIYQLEPSFSGEKTHSLGLDTPLFWRVYKNFEKLPKELWSISILKTQYRMNTSLSKFISPLIYNTPLQKPAVNVPNRIPNIKTHLLFVEQAVEGCGKDERERMVSKLVKAAVKAVKASGKNGVRFGVMTCDAREVEGLQVLLPKREFPEVVVEQLLAFQGKEFEVIVFYHDGRKMLTSWLSAALTRARCSLFVFASEKTIGGNSFMRKMAEKAEKYSFLKHVHPEMTEENFEQMITT